MTHRLPAQHEHEPQPWVVEGHGGIKLTVWAYPGAGVPVVFCHCTGGLGRLWDPVVAALGPGFQCWAVDARGHGESAKPDSKADYRWECSGRDLVAVVQALGLEGRAFAVGHSAGGAHAIYAELAAPGLFRAMALIDPVAGPIEIMQGGGLALAEGARRRKSHFTGHREAHERLSGKAPMNTWSADALEAYIEHGLEPHGHGVMLRCPPQIEAWCYENGGAGDAYERLSDIPVPTLLVSGEHSGLLPLARHQQECLPDARLHVVEGAGHFVPQEQPEALAAVLRDWLLRQAASGAPV